MVDAVIVSTARTGIGKADRGGLDDTGGVMTDIHEKRPLEIVRQDFRQLSVGAWVAIVGLVALLVIAIVGISLSGTDDLASGVSGPGTIAMIFGGLFTIVVGGGLMGLIFYSSRHGYDDPPAADSRSEDHPNFPA